MMTIAILGARGQVGRAVARAFHRRGYDVIAVTRDGRAEGLPVGTAHRAADATDTDALVRATEGADLIFNGLNPDYTQWDRFAVPMAESVLAAARTHNATHLFPGNVYNFGREIPALVTEATPFRASTPKAATRIAMEERFARAATEDATQTLILRAGDFFGGDGDGRASWFRQALIAKLDRGIFTYPGPMDRPHAWAYLPDLAEAFADLAEARHGLDRFAWFGFDGHCLTGAEMKAAVERAAGRPLRTRRMPWTLMRAVGVVNPMIRELTRMSYLWSAPHRVSGAWLSSIIGTIPHTPTDSAVGIALGAAGSLDYLGNEASQDSLRA
ncbi:NAD-dependent epimerase/dehydratase family protein [Fodinicurvata sp. EGI_FJ10296]|uniref:NAD-dependent epimerase/dehydratase family protein n=1 Tax=Fodinicurvata sp. EGI_FJ10296 TaxID=3231908 RepID=UPI0034530882